MTRLQHFCFVYIFFLLPLETVSLSTIPTKKATPQNIKDKRLFPFQRQGIDRLVNDERLLLADEMGLGKTVQCIGAINKLLTQGTLDSSSSKILVVCPKSVVTVWQDELEQWLEHEVQVNVAAAGRKNLPIEETAGFSTILLINYDICHKHKEELQSIAWDVLICDEAHYLKSMYTKRTLAVLGNGSMDQPGILSTYLWLLTGTPIMNRPVELYPMLQALAPNEFDSFGDFCERYCNSRTKYVKGRLVEVNSGASNLSELSKRLDPIMLRRYKSDVLTQLPPKFRSCLCLLGGDIANQERQRIKDIMTETGMGEFGFDADSLSSLMTEMDGAPDSRIMGLLATVRRETAMNKVKPAIEMLKEVIQSNKVVVFCHHRQVILDLMEAFGTKIAVHIMGGMDNESRAEAVRRFQNEEHVRLFIGSIRAAGVGLTLTAASHVIFLELDWSPAIMCQAEDRCHRVGQKDSVNVQYYVFKGTIDEMLARALVTKQMDIDQVLNADTSAPQAGYVFNFGKHKGLRLEDVPRNYLQFVVRTSDIWKKRPALWRALHQQGLVNESPPPVNDTARKSSKSLRNKEEAMHEAVDFVFDFGKHNGKTWSDVPLSYREWVIQEGVWKNKPNLMGALRDVGLIEIPVG